MEEIYDLVAQKFAQRVEEVFESEATLEEAFHALFKGLEFNRTDHWNNILRSEFNKIWIEYGPAVKSVPVHQDVKQTLERLARLLDYNIFSQVLLNLQTYLGWGYSVPDGKAALQTLQERYQDKEPTPFAPKARMLKEANTTEEKNYNLDLSAIKALKIIANFTPMFSFRVSPKGGTPALADSQNLSMLGLGADQYVRALPGLFTYYITWQPGHTPNTATLQEDGSFRAEGIPYPFTSKSGGEILNEVLFTRKLAVHFFIACKPQVVLPRMNSVTIVAPQAAGVHQVYQTLAKQFPVLEFHQGSRTCSAETTIKG